MTGTAATFAIANFGDLLLLLLGPAAAAGVTHTLLENTYSSL